MAESSVLRINARGEMLEVDSGEFTWSWDDAKRIARITRSEQGLDATASGGIVGQLALEFNGPQ